MTPADDEHITVSILSLSSGHPEHRVRAMADSGVLPHTKAGRIRLFRKADIQTLCELLDRHAPPVLVGRRPAEPAIAPATS